MTTHDRYEDMQEAAAAEKGKHLALSLDNIRVANERFFLRECMAAGVDPAMGMSPSLLKILGWRPPPDRVAAVEDITSDETRV